MDEMNESNVEVIQRIVFEWEKYRKALLDIICLGTGNVNRVFIQQFNHAAIEIAKKALEEEDESG